MTLWSRRKPRRITMSSLDVVLSTRMTVAIWREAGLRGWMRVVWFCPLLKRPTEEIISDFPVALELGDLIRMTLDFGDGSSARGVLLVGIDVPLPGVGFGFADEHAAVLVDYARRGDRAGFDDFARCFGVADLDDLWHETRRRLPGAGIPVVFGDAQ